MAALTRSLSKILAALAVAASAHAEHRVTDNNAHLWVIYDGQHPLGTSKWRFNMDAQWRRSDLGLTWQQLLLRPSIGYAFNRRLNLAGGYAFVETYPYGSFPFATRFSEHRAWEQATLAYNSGKVAWASRFRFENRWIQNVGRQDWRYENRLRLLQRMTVPLKGTSYLNLHNEFWILIPPYLGVSWFDQNRAYAGFGWRVADGWNVEAGYMNQALLRRSGLILESNHTVRLTLISTARIGKP